MELNHQKSLEFKEHVRRALPPHASQSWLSSLQLLKITPSKVVLGGIKHKIYRYEIKTNHESLLKEVLNELFPENAPFSEKNFEYKIGGFSNLMKSVQNEFDLDQDKDKFAGKNNAKILTQSSCTTEFVPGSTISFSLDSYIPGKRNLLASRACRAVVDSPGVAFNPFVIYGNLGSGKTHLLEGVNNELKQYNPKINTVQVSAEDFLNDFINHLRMRKMKEFRDSYRKIDAFILDDLQALVPSAKCQTELLYTINALLRKKAQIIIASQEAPTRISELISGLRGKLESGLTVDIGIPDDLTRVEILERKAKERGIPLSNELAHFIVKHIKGGIGRMEGVLMRLGIHASLLNEELTIDLARYSLKDWLDESTKNTNFDKHSHVNPVVTTEKKILQHICTIFQINEEGLHSYRRDRQHIKARQATIYLLKKLTSLSLSEIGKIVGRDHSTVHASLKKVKERMSIDGFFQKQIQTFLREFEEKPSSKQILAKKATIVTESRAN